MRLTCVALCALSGAMAFADALTPAEKCVRLAGAAATVIPRAGTADQKLRSRVYLMPQDFETKRSDGRYENHMAFAWDYVRRMVPEYSFDKVKDGAEIPAWREINASVAWPEYTYRDQSLAGASEGQSLLIK